MPVMELLVKRVGPCTVTLSEGPGNAGFNYLFTPVPFAEKDEMSTSICRVDKESHLEWMRKFPGTYREYDAKRTQRELEEDRKKSNIYEGFAIEKYFDKGYILVDYRDKRNVKFMDQKGSWTDTRSNLEAFINELQAWEFLKNEVDLFQPKAEKNKGGRPRKKEPEEEGGGSNTGDDLDNVKGLVS